MILRSLFSRRGARRRLLVPIATGAMVLASCSSGGSAASVDGDVDDTGSDDVTGDVSAQDPSTDDGSDADTTAATPDAGTSTGGEVATTDNGGSESASATLATVEVGDLGAVGSLASTEVHDIGLEFDQAEYDTMVATYLSTEDKEWISATVTIDGVSYEQVGLRLKGNSSLRSISADDDPATIPWLVRLDEFVDGQNHDGLEEFVIRSSSSTTALNEAVALELLELAGLASQDAVSVRLSVNDGEQVLRLVIDSPDGEWMAEEFSDTGALYKAESTGDWNYRGDDPESYDEVFDQEAGDDNADLTPLMAFLDFVNNSDDATFETELGDWLDLESFATYLAMQDLLDNFDDINGPGNNAYLYYDTEAERFTVVPWDYNLAFGQRPMGGPGGGGFPRGDGDRQAPPSGTGGDGTPILIDPDDAVAPPDGGFPGGEGGGMNRENPLVDRFLAVDAWNELYQQAASDLQASLYDSGTAAALLQQWSSIIATSGLVDQATIDADATAIESYLD